MCNTVVRKQASKRTLMWEITFELFADIDECGEPSVCGDHAVCENVNGGFNCFCMEGYQTATGKSQFTPNDGSYCQGDLEPSTWNYMKYLLHICEASRCYSAKVKQAKVKKMKSRTKQNWYWEGNLFGKEGKEWDKKGGWVIKIYFEQVWNRQRKGVVCEILPFGHDMEVAHTNSQKLWLPT